MVAKRDPWAQFADAPETGAGPYQPVAAPAAGGGTGELSRPVAPVAAPPQAQPQADPFSAFSDVSDKTEQQLYSGPSDDEVDVTPETTWQQDAARTYFAKQYRKRLNDGENAGALVKYLADNGYDVTSTGMTDDGKVTPSVAQQVQAQVNFKKQYPGVDMTDEAFDDRFANLGQVAVAVDPTTQARAEALDSGPGAFGAAFGSRGAFGTEDEAAGALGYNGEQTQALKEAIRERHPYASAAGDVAGFMAQTLGAGKLLGLGAKGTIAADAALGAAHGAGENNDDRLRGAAIEGGLTAAGGAVGSKIASKLASRAPSEGAQRVARAVSQDIDLPLGATSRAAAGFERGLDIAPPTANTMQGARDSLSAQVDAAVARNAGQYGGAAGSAQIGEAAQRGARAWISKFEKTADTLYSKIPIRAQSPATFFNAKQYLRDVSDQFSSNPALQSALRDPKVVQFFKALDDPSARLNWGDLKAFRTRIGEKIGAKQYGEDTSESTLRGLYGALSEDMRATASARGPDALRAFERANDFYKQGQDRIQGALVSILGKDGSMSAEAAATKLQTIAKDGKSSSDIRKLAEIRKSIPADEWGDVAGGLVRLLGKPANNPGREFDPGVFVRNYDDMEPAAKNLLFADRGRGSLRASLDEFTEVMRDIGKSNSLRNTSNTASSMTNAGVGGGMVAAMMNPVLAAKGAVTAAGLYGLGKLWTNPRFVQWATGYARFARNQAAAAAGAPVPVGRQIELLGKVGTSQPAIQAEVIQLQNYLREAFSQSPMRAAAEGQQEEDGGQIPPDQEE